MHARVFADISVKSTKPVTVVHSSRNMQSTCFNRTMAVPKDKRAKGETENKDPNNTDVFHDVKKIDTTPVKSAKKANTPASRKASLASIFSDNSSHTPRLHSAKKQVKAPPSVFSFAGMSDMNAPSPRLVPTTIAAGAKPRPLEKLVRSRGPVGGRVSVIFG